MESIYRAAAVYGCFGERVFGFPVCTCRTSSHSVSLENLLIETDVGRPLLDLMLLVPICLQGILYFLNKPEGAFETWTCRLHLERLFLSMVHTHPSAHTPQCTHTHPSVHGNVVALLSADAAELAALTQCCYCSQRLNPSSPGTVSDSRTHKVSLCPRSSGGRINPEYCQWGGWELGKRENNKI